jgi:anaerobic selenocysteine-containing dehydrogenase
MTPSKDRFGKEQYPLFPEVSFSYFKEALLRDDPKCPKAMIVMHANPVLVQANSNRTRQALEKLELIIVNDIFMTATGEMADIVFPDTSPFERWSYRAYSSYDRPFVVCGRPLVDPPGQARTSYETERELAQRMGLEGAYPFQNDWEQVDYMLSPTGITMKQLDEQQYCFAEMHPEERKYIKQGFFPGGGKLKFYSEEYKQAGYPPMPIYRDPAGGLACVSQAYPLLCTSRRPREFVHTKLHNMEATTRLHRHAQLWISQADATARGLKEGDFSILKTEIGQARFCIHIADRQPVGLVAAEFGWGNPTDDGPDVNSLIADGAWDPISGATPNRLFVCQVEKAVD